MKTIAKILAGLFLLAVIYFIVADGMMVHFGLSQGIQLFSALVTKVK